MKRQDTSKQKREIIIINERILEFYEKNPQLNIEKINILYIELFENISSASFDNSQVVNTILSTLTNQTNDLSILKYSTESYKSDISNIRDMYSLSINNIKSEIENIKSTFTNISSTLITKIYESKDNYICELKEILKNVDIESKQNINNLLEKQNNILSEKLLILINETLPKTQTNQYNDMITNFKKEIETSFSDIKSQDPQIIIEKINNIVEHKYNNLLTNIHENISNNIAQSENRLNTNMNYIKDLSTRNTHTQENINEELLKYINKHNNPCSKGTMGENLLYKILSDELPTGDIVNTSNYTGRGDFIIKRKDKEDILIETKDYTSNVKKEEVDKFIRDVNNNECHGIFLSQNSGIVNRENYQIEINNNKILIYIHKMNYEPYKIGLAIKLIDLLSEKLTRTNNDNIIIPTYTLKEINNDYQSLYLLKDKLIMDLKDYTKKTLERYESINICSLEKFLSNYYANIKKNTYLCEYCKNYSCEKLISMARHKSSCRIKYNNKISEKIESDEVSNDEIIYSDESIKCSEENKKIVQKGRPKKQIN